MTVRVVVADDNYLLREGLERLLATVDDLEVVASVGDYDSLLAAVDEHRPDAVLADIRMPPTHTDEGVRAALADPRRPPGDRRRACSASTPARRTPATLLGGTTTGIGYLLKDRVSDVDQLAGALRTVATGGSVVDPLVVEELIAARRVLADSPLAALTEREQEVLAAMAEGLSNAAIATRTYSSERTVEKHIATIFTKLELANEPDTNRRVKAVLVYLTELSR